MLENEDNYNWAKYIYEHGNARKSRLVIGLFENHV